MATIFCEKVNPEKNFLCYNSRVNSQEYINDSCSCKYESGRKCSKKDGTWLPNFKMNLVITKQTNFFLSYRLIQELVRQLTYYVAHMSFPEVEHTFDLQEIQELRIMAIVGNLTTYFHSHFLFFQMRNKRESFLFGIIWDLAIEKKLASKGTKVNSRSNLLQCFYETEYVKSNN